MSEAAVQQLIQAVVQDPGADSPRQLLLERLLSEHDLAGALRALTTSGIPSPWKSSVVGSVFLAAGAVDEALTVFDQLVSEHPEHAEFWLQRSLCHGRRGRLELALRDLNRYLEILPCHWKGLWRRGEIWTKMGEWERALEDLTLAVERSPEETEPRLALAGVALETGRPELALGQLDRLAGEHPQDARILYLRARARLTANLVEPALADLEAALRAGLPESELLILRARARAQAGEREAAAADFARALSDADGGAQAALHVEHAAQLALLARHEEAREALHSALARDPSVEKLIRRHGHELASLAWTGAHLTCRALLEKAFAGRYGRRPDWVLLEDRVADSLRGWRNDWGWHLVALGLSELDHKKEDCLERSGLGLELSLRVPGSLPVPPLSALEVLREAVQALRRLGRPPRADEPVLLSTRTGAMTSALLVPDADWPEPLSTSFGKVAVLQLVGLTADETRVVTRDGSRPVLSRLAEIDPLFLFDPGRNCLTQAGLQASTPAPATLNLKLLRWECDSSYEGSLFLSQGDVPDLRLALGTGLAQELHLTTGGDTSLLPSSFCKVILHTSGELEFGEQEGLLRLGLPPQVVRKILLELEARCGAYWFSPGLTIKVVQERDGGRS